MAAANASAAWSGSGMRSSESRWRTMYCTWSFSAEPSPTTASFIWRGVYSPTARPPSAQATSAAPRAWPVAKAAVTFWPNQTVSMPDAFGAKPLDHCADLVVDLHQPLGQRLRCRRGHAPIGHARTAAARTARRSPSPYGRARDRSPTRCASCQPKDKPHFPNSSGAILEHMFVKSKQNYGRKPMPPSSVRVSPLMNLKSGLRELHHDAADFGLHVAVVAHGGHVHVGLVRRRGRPPGSSPAAAVQASGHTTFTLMPSGPHSVAATRRQCRGCPPWRRRRRTGPRCRRGPRRRRS